MSRFGSFWQGPRLSGFEAACLHSFVAAGHEVTLFSYEPVAQVPRGVIQCDARSIADESLNGRFQVDGRPSISHFSDYFRYRMFQCTDLTWIDTDVLLLHSWKQDPDEMLLALETPDSICNAVMRIPSKQDWLPQLVQGAEALVDKPMRWGDTGPRLITKLVGQQQATQRAAPPSVYFPIHYDEFWKAFLPEYSAECERLCAGARTLHLWNNIVDRLGFWKEFLPPEGSYLHRHFVAAGAERYFKGVFPLRNMQQLVENWLSRQSGEHLGIGNVVRQFIPSIRRTVRHYGH